MPLLQIESGPHRGKTIRFSDGIIVIGRGETANLKIGSAEISREHCRIRVDGDNVFVCDLGSANGTYVDGNVIAAVKKAAGTDGPISGETLLAVGAHLHIGPMAFRRIDPNEPIKPAAEIDPPPAPHAPAETPAAKPPKSSKVSARVLKASQKSVKEPSTNTASEDDALAWLTEDVPNPASGESDTSILTGAQAAPPKPRVFESVAEEAADIFRRHREGER